MTTDNEALVRELLPCPFCGADAEIEQGSDHHGEWFNLGCSRHWGHVRNPDHQNTCIAGRIFYTETDVTEAEAIASWNTRPAPQPKPLDPPAQDEVVLDALRDAYWAGASAVHNAWVNDLGQNDPDFGEAASDYAQAATAALRQHQSAEIEALRVENARLRGALKDSAGSLSWAARQMKGNCRGSDIDAVNLAAGRAANSAALEGGAK